MKTFTSASLDNSLKGKDASYQHPKDMFVASYRAALSRVQVKMKRIYCFCLMSVCVNWPLREFPHHLLAGYYQE